MDMFVALTAPVSLPHVEGTVYGFIAVPTSRGTVDLPVTVPGCAVCGGALKAGPIGGGCRVSGDSRYGYEALHQECSWG